MAEGLFAGVTQLDVATHGNNVEVRFQADLPFQYAKKVLNADQVELTLLNARLADRLASMDGTLAVMPTPAVQSVTRVPSNQGQEKLILNGLGLGKKVLIVEGATLAQLPVAENSKIASQPASKPVDKQVSKQASKVAGKQTAQSMEKPVVVFPTTSRSDLSEPISMLSSMSEPPSTSRIDISDSVPKHAEVPDTPVTPGASGGSPVGLDTGFLAELTHPQSEPRQTPFKQPSAVMNLDTGPASPGPVIAQVENLPYERSAPVMTVPQQSVVYPQYPTYGYAPPVYTPPPAYPAYMPLPPEYYTGYQAYPPPPVEPEPAVVEAPPADVPVKPIPRYKGGSPPISFTVAGTGETVTLAPGVVGDYTDLPEQSAKADHKKDDGPYNTLAIADKTSVEAKALIRKALDAYRDGHYDQAKIQVDQAIVADKKNPELYAALGEIEVKRHHLEKAITAYAAARTLSPGKFDRRYAQLLILAGKRQEAVQALKTTLSGKPEDAGEIHFMLGTLLEQLGNTSEALTHLKKASELKPKSADIQYNLGLAYELEGNRNQAKVHYEQAVELDPMAEDAQRALQRVQG